MEKTSEAQVRGTPAIGSEGSGPGSDLRCVKVGQRAVVSQIKSCPKDLLRKLLSMGIVEGTEVCVTQRGFFGSPINIHLLGSVLSLRSAEAALIQVQPL